MTACRPQPVAYPSAELRKADERGRLGSAIARPSLPPSRLRANVNLHMIGRNTQPGLDDLMRLRALRPSESEVYPL
jgi:hypothetical protein